MGRSDVCSCNIVVYQREDTASRFHPVRGENHLAEPWHVKNNGTSVFNSSTLKGKNTTQREPRSVIFTRQMRLPIYVAPCKGLIKCSAWRSPIFTAQYMFSMAELYVKLLTGPNTDSGNREKQQGTAAE